MTRSVARYVPSSTRIPSVGAAVCRRAARVDYVAGGHPLALGHPRVEGDEPSPVVMPMRRWRSASSANPPSRIASRRADGRYASSLRDRRRTPPRPRRR